MPVNISFTDDSQRVLLLRFHDPLSIEDIISALDNTLIFLDKAPGKIVGLIDLRETSAVPRDLFLSFPRIAGHPARSHPNSSRRLIFIVKNPTVDRALKIFFRIYGSALFFTTEDEAIAAVADELSKLK